SLFVVFFFFFQAEDGIRDATVTGVQTCALPILRTRISFFPRFLSVKSKSPVDISTCIFLPKSIDSSFLNSENFSDARALSGLRRSEERRVGKEWKNRR